MPTDPGSCDSTTKADNRKIALRRNPVGSYGEARVLNVTARDPVAKTFNFQARGTNGLVNDYKDVAWADETKMWVACPSSLPSRCADPDDPTNPGKPPLVGAAGILLVEKNWADNLQLPIDHSTPKWPGSLPSTDPLYGELSLVPYELVIKGRELDSGNDVVATIDLLDPALADVNQTILLNRDRTTLRVSGAVFGTFFVGFPPAVDFKAEVAAAVATIQSTPTDPAEMARAWGLIANAVAMMRLDSGVVSPALLELVQRVVPELVI